MERKYVNSAFEMKSHLYPSLQGQEKTRRYEMHGWNVDALPIEAATIRKRLHTPRTSLRCV